MLSHTAFSVHASVSNTPSSLLHIDITDEFCLRYYVMSVQPTVDIFKLISKQKCPNLSGRQMLKYTIITEILNTQ
jgi:hypothetical protein